jgi:predicted ester cyclase
MTDYQAAKSLVRQCYREFDGSAEKAAGRAFAQYARSDYRFRGVHPFNELQGAEAVAASVWEPLRRAFKQVQRREDVFMAGTNELDGQTWVCSMGHLMGLHDGEWLGIPPTGRLAFLRYVDFHRIQDDRIAETAFFCDIIGVMKQAGISPLPLQTGAELIVPGPRTHDGLLFNPQSEFETVKSLELVNLMRRDLNADGFDSPGQSLDRTWHEDMLWFGPSGIGSTYTFGRYQEQHQGPFANTLRDIKSNGHICRFAEGTYAGWFGWPNLTMTSVGGFLGMPSHHKRLDMRVVDVYRREGDKLAENWIFIDLLYWLLQQDVDLLERTRSILRR